MGRLFSLAVFSVTGSLSFGGRLLFPRGKGKLLAAFLGQGVAILVLNQTIEVQVGDALSNAGFADVEICILLNALPEVALKNSKADVTLVLDFVLMNDVENHVIVLVQVIHDAGFGE